MTAKMKTKTFARHRTLTEIKAQCSKQRLYLNDYRYRICGSDYVTIKRSPYADMPHDHVLFNTASGCFHGECTVEGERIMFSSDATEYDDQPWMQALLGFFYTNDPLLGKKNGK